MADTAEHSSPQIRDWPGRDRPRGVRTDRFFFFLGTVAAVWLAWALLEVSLSSWGAIGLAVVFWLALAYLALPRLNRILASIYVPDYFIGRTRTSDGLLGDPVNLAFVGTGEQLSSALARAGWIAADPVDFKSSVRIVMATLTKRSYPEAPVSPLLLFERGQDAAYQQEVDGNPGQRHHVRFWRTPEGWLLPGGHRVDYLGDASYDTRVTLSLFTLQITHKVAADIDVERDYIVNSLVHAEPDATVVPLRDFTTGYHSRNGGGDRFHTDGTLPIVDLSKVAPDPTAPDIGPAPPSARVPITVWFGAGITFLSGIGALLDLGSIEGGATAVAVASGIGVLAAVLALLTLRRSDRARRGALVLVALEAASRVATYYLAATPHGRLVAILHAAGSVLALVALSSPSAHAWTVTAIRRRPSSPSDQG